MSSYLRDTTLAFLRGICGIVLTTSLHPSYILHHVKHDMHPRMSIPSPVPSRVITLAFRCDTPMRGLP